MSEALLRGAKLLGFEPHPDQLALGEMLDTHPETTAVSWPRRAGKTEAIWMWLLGMCDLHEFFHVVVTAQTGSKSRERFLSAARRLDRFYPEDIGGPHIKRGSIVDMDFSNGSRLWSISPDPDNFRGDAINVALLDEAQSYSVQRSLDLRQAVPPVLDTVADGQIILAGTPGPVRAGWYWDALEAGRAGAPGHALSEFMLADHEDVEDEDNWIKVHPGLRHGLTTIDRMRARRAGMSEPAWRMEYMGQWPPDSGTDAISVQAWEQSQIEATDRPERVGIAFDVSYDGSSAAIALAWRVDGVAHVEIVAHRLGSSWVAVEARRATEKFRRSAVAYDDIGANRDPAAGLIKNRVKTDRLTMKDTMAAAQRIVSDIHENRLRHFGQAALDLAVSNTTWRDIQGSGRAFGQKVNGGNAINPLVAASLALWSYDKGKDGGANRPLV